MCGGVCGVYVVCARVWWGGVGVGWDGLGVLYVCPVGKFRQ